MMYLVAWIWSWCPTTIQYDLNVCLHIAPSGFLFSAFFCKNAQSGWIWWETKFSTQNLATMALFILSPQINKQFIMAHGPFIVSKKWNSHQCCVNFYKDHYQVYTLHKMDLESKFCYVSSTPQDQPGSVQNTPNTQYTHQRIHEETTTNLF